MSKTMLRSEQPQHLVAPMFPLNVSCSACGEEMQINERSLSGAEQLDDDSVDGVVIPSSLDRRCGAQAFCLWCARAVRALAPDDINLAVLDRARKAAILPKQHLIDLYYAALDDEEAALRADHHGLDLESDDYEPFGGEVVCLQPPADLEVDARAATTAHHYRVLVARYPRPGAPAPTGLLLS